jgi:hypothetical protein
MHQKRLTVATLGFDMLTASAALGSSGAVPDTEHHFISSDFNSFDDFGLGFNALILTALKRCSFQAVDIE